MDSRAYVFIFPIETAADIPADFPPAVKGLVFETGVFLPQDDANWFTRPPENPARLLLLSGKRLHIIPHPASSESGMELPLDDLVQLEVGNILLLGWIALDTSCAKIRLSYNTRASRPLDRFVERLADRWLRESSGGSAQSAAVFGPERHIKFNYLLRYSLGSGELPQSVFFSPPVPFREKTLMFKRLDVHPGHLLATTSRGRLLWATDEHKRRYERYAAIARSSPIGLLQHSELKAAADHQELVITFGGSRTWQVPIYTSGSEARRFCQWLNENMSGQILQTTAPHETNSVQPQPICGNKPQPGSCESQDDARGQV